MKNQLNIPLKIKNYDFPSMDYINYGIKGVGKNRIPILSMDKYIDQTYNNELHLECCKGLAKCAMVTPGGMFYGGVPDETIEYFDGSNSWDVMLRNLQKKESNSEHIKTIYEILDGPEDDDYKKSCVWRYMYYALGAIVPWFFVVYIKVNHFTSKNSDTNANWSPYAKHFPKLLEYIKSLPFESVGRVLFFTTYPNAQVPIHRDSVVKEHSDHNINLFFAGGDRKSFVFDPELKEKVYLEPGSKSYFFNNRDFHGVDPEPKFRYTLRIDGTFNKKIIDDLQLENGYTWKWDYEK